MCVLPREDEDDCRGWWGWPKEGGGGGGVSAATEGSSGSVALPTIDGAGVEDVEEVVATMDIEAPTCSITTTDDLLSCPEPCDEVTEAAAEEAGISLKEGGC